MPRSKLIKNCCLGVMLVGVTGFSAGLVHNFYYGSQLVDVPSQVARSYELEMKINNFKPNEYNAELHDLKFEYEQLLADRDIKHFREMYDKYVKN